MKNLLTLLIAILITLYSATLTSVGAASENHKSILSQTIARSGIAEIQIQSALCRVLIDKTAHDFFDVQLSYPDSLKTEISSSCLVMEKKESKLIIATALPENLGDGSGEEYTLTIKIPDKQYDFVWLKLTECHKSILNMDVDTSKLLVQTSVGDVSMNTNKAYDDLTISHKYGNFKLTLDNFGKETSVFCNTGQFHVKANQEITDGMFTIINNKKSGGYAKYRVPASWATSVSYGEKKYNLEYELISSKVGRGTTTFTSTNTNGGFIFETPTNNYQGTLK